MKKQRNRKLLVLSLHTVNLCSVKINKYHVPVLSSLWNNESQCNDNKYMQLYVPPVGAAGICASSYLSCQILNRLLNLTNVFLHTFVSLPSTSPTCRRGAPGSNVV